MRPNKCKHCESPYHYSFQCHTQRKPIKSKSLIEQAGEHLETIRVAQNKIKAEIAKVTPKRDKCVAELLKLAVVVFHKFIKKRDSHDNHFYCISCNHLLPLIAAQAGHYRNGTISSLKFNEYNVSLECVQCNCHNPNHLIGYRRNLINKIGLDKVEELESVPFSQEHKWDREELLSIIKKYRL